MLYFWQYCRCKHANYPIFSQIPLPIHARSHGFSFPLLPHLNKSIIRWIAVRWLPNKAVQIGVTTGSKESMFDGLGYHRIAVLTIHVSPVTTLLVDADRGESKSRRESRVVMHTPPFSFMCAGRCMQTGAAGAPADGLYSPCSTGSCQSPTHQTVLCSLMPPVFLFCVHHDLSLYSPVLFLVPVA